MTTRSTTFGTIAAQASLAETTERTNDRKLAAVFYAPRRKSINPKRMYQVTVNGAPVKGKGLTSEAWKTAADAKQAATIKRAYLATTWGKDAPTVAVQTAKEPVQTVHEWIDADARLFRSYSKNGSGYRYSGTSY